MPYFIFLAGLCIGSLLTKKSNVVVVDNGTVAAEVKGQDLVMVVREGQSTEVRTVRDNPPPVKTEVENPDGGKFYRDSFGEWTMSCKTCTEEVPAEKETAIWKSQDRGQ